MGFVRHKKINNRIYAYEVTCYWDAKKKAPRQRSKYLGIVTDSGEVQKRKEMTCQRESMILDFGDGYIVDEFFKQSIVYEIIKDVFKDHFEEMSVLIIYKIIMQSAMYNCELWLHGNVISRLYPKIDLSSQNTSRILSFLSDENKQRQFFSEYIKKIGGVSDTIIIDATSLPNQISSEFNAWGRCDGSIDKQIRLLCVLNYAGKTPVYYRSLPGNIVDINTLFATIEELKEMGVKSSFLLIDAGYFSESNVHELYKNRINFMSRLPASRALFKEIMNKDGLSIDRANNAIQFGDRALFVKEEEVQLYGNKAYAYIVLDPVRKGKEINETLIEHFNSGEVKEIPENELYQCGVMILISSKKIERQKAVDLYYTRQSVEQVFGFYKDDLDSLPLRRHNDDTLRGYLFLQFLVLILFITMRQKLMKQYTVEQAMLIMRALKCKIYSSRMLIAEVTKQQKEISELLGIIMPKFLGI